MPTIGLVTWISLRRPERQLGVGAVLNVVDGDERVLHGGVDGAHHFRHRLRLRASASIIALVISKYWPPLLVATACSAPTSAAGGAIATT